MKLRELSEGEMQETVGGCWITDGSNHHSILEVCAGGGGGGSYPRTRVYDVRISDYGYPPNNTAPSSGQKTAEPRYNARRDDPEIFMMIVEDPHGFRPGSWTAPSGGWEGMR